MLATAWPWAAPPSRFGARSVSDTLKPTKISREGVILIKSFEGFRPRAIQRADGRWTIGYGHTQSAREGLTVSESDAELLLQYDLIPVAKAVDTVQAALNQHQYDALASFAFSVGVDRFRTSDVLARLNAGAPAEAADALIAWNDDSGIDAPPRRRAAERALFVARPDAPVSLADLLAAPLPPPAVTLVEATVATAADVQTFETPEAAPFPADLQISPMTREAAVAALLGEEPAAFPAQGDAAPKTEAEVEPEAEVEVEVVSSQIDPQIMDEGAADPTPSEAPTAIEENQTPGEASVEIASPPETPESSPPPPPARPAWGAPNPASFYSPYSLRASGPLLLGASRPQPSAPAPTASIVEPVAETPLSEAPVEDLAEAPVETVAGISVGESHMEPASETETVETAEAESETGQAADTVETTTSPEAEAEAEAETTETTEAAEFETEVQPVAEIAAPVAVEPLQYRPPQAFADLPEQPVLTPVFAPSFSSFDAPAPEAPPLVLTEAPGLQETTAEHRLAWPETGSFAHADQTHLFETEADQDVNLEVRPAGEPPRRLDWSETATFLIMGGIGLVSFGAAMAAFRRASESNGGDTALIGWVLAVIALACVSVSGYNLYQRWGRADRA